MIQEVKVKSRQSPNLGKTDKWDVRAVEVSIEFFLNFLVKGAKHGYAIRSPGR